MLPPFAPPIARPQIVHAFMTVNLCQKDAGRVLDRLFDMVHGQNYNDPQRFISHGYERLRTQGLGGRP